MRSEKIRDKGMILSLVLFLFMMPVSNHAFSNEVSVEVHFSESAQDLTSDERDLIKGIIEETAHKSEKLFNRFPDSIKVEVSIIDRDLSTVHGVTGRAMTHDPAGHVIVEISEIHTGGIAGAVDAGLRAVLFHEFHHLSRGWSITQNEFGRGIDIAAVNEGLAVVFAEEYSGVKSEGNAYPKEVEEWVQEILELPEDAEYSTWVSGIHPDGRAYIGYRAGNYLIRKAMNKSGMSILELSVLNPEEIIEMAGY
ncbi:DUF2268 domain-containing putative Zn-dependent protease [Balneola sp. MJW-20]|uniref:DUF2268 domain-containing putative Zn-dependent protease n=1 Tax=Gracilimonas aurantiaca TaxID=3234185 RepID=UPI003466B230